MNSFNHYAFGAVGEWMYENILGIQPDPNSPGFKHFILKPLPGGSLTWAEGSYHSISGKIEAKWKKIDGKFEYHIVVPPNTTATVHMPSTGVDQVWLDGKKISGFLTPDTLIYTDGYVVFEVESGSYQFQSTMPAQP